MRFRTIATVFFLSSVLLSSPALAQQRHIVNPSDMRQAITTQAQAQGETRDAIRAVLKTSQVQAVAERLGVSVTSAESAVAMLTTAELEQLAGPVQAVSAELAGGSTVVIGTTTLLLIIIIIILLT
jgi:hypothetical protein